MSQKKIDILERALAREKASRKQAEKILEVKSAELYKLSLKLSKVNSELEGSIQEKTSQLKGIFENIVDAYVVMDLQGMVLKMNQAAIDMLGYDSTKESINLFDLVYPKDRTKTINGFKELVEKNVLTNFQIKVITKELQYKIVQVNASIVFDKKNKPIAAQGIVRDITKEKESQEKLKASENRLATLILNLDSGVLLEDEHNLVVVTNRKFCDLFLVDLKPKDLVGIDCSKMAKASKDLFENSDSFVSRINELVASKKMVLADELVMKNGKILERDYVPIFEQK